MSKAIVEIPMIIKDEDIDNWLCGAFEGGSNYWCSGIKVKDNDYKGTKYASECVSKGGIIIATTLDDDIDYFVSKIDILNGLKWLANNGYTKCLNRLLNERYDADDSDAIFQVACFGEVIYG